MEPNKIVWHYGTCDLCGKKQTLICHFGYDTQPERDYRICFKCFQKYLKVILFGLTSMRTNNELIIIEKGKRKYEIHSNDCVDNEFTPSEETLLCTQVSLRKAIEWANKYYRENIVEYGYEVRLK